MTRQSFKQKYVSVAEAEYITGISRWTWRKKAYRGEIASGKVGTRLVLPLSEVERVMDGGLRPAVLQ